MSASGEAVLDLTDKLNELEVTDSPCQDHGDEPSDFERSTKTLLDLEEQLRELQEMQLQTTERNNALQAEIQQLREKRVSDKQKYKTLFLGHEKYARMKAEYKEMSKFIKAHKDEVEAVRAKVEQQEGPPQSQLQPPPPPPPPPPSPQPESPPQQTAEPVAIKRHAIRGEPCLTLTRSEVCRLEQDVLGLRDLLSRREESWRRAKAREMESRKKMAALSAELATVRQLAQMRRNQADELAHRLQEALLELKKHKVDNEKLRNNVVRLRNRERSLLISLPKKSKKGSVKAERKKGRQQRRKLASQKQAKSSVPQGSVISSHQGRSEGTPKGILRVQCCPPPRT